MEQGAKGIYFVCQGVHAKAVRLASGPLREGGSDATEKAGLQWKVELTVTLNLQDSGSKRHIKILVKVKNI